MGRSSWQAFGALLVEVMRKTERVLPPFGDPPDRILPVCLLDHLNVKSDPPRFAWEQVWHTG